MNTAVRALLSKGDTAYCSIERADQQSAVSALRAYLSFVSGDDLSNECVLCRILCVQELASK